MKMFKKILSLAILAMGLNMLPMSTSAQTTETKTKSRKAWSHRKKGAVIGAGAGAVTGAVISKDHAKGAVIGGAVGAGAGYLIGKHKDKEDPAPKRVYKTKTTRG